MPEEKVKEGEVSTKFYNFLAKQISRKSDYYWRFYSTFLVNTNMANISANINFKLVGRKSLRRRGGNKFLFCPTKKNFRPIGVFLTILEALSCKTKYRKYLAKYPFPGIHICVTYFQYCNNEPDIPKSSIKQLWNLDPRYTSISPRSDIESYIIWHLELSWSTGRSQILVDSWSGWPVRSVVHDNVQAPQYLRWGGNYYWSLYLHILPERHKKLSGVVLDKVHNDWHIVLQLRLCVSCNGHL